MASRWMLSATLLAALIATTSAAWAQPGEGSASRDATVYVGDGPSTYADAPDVGAELHPVPGGVGGELGGCDSGCDGGSCGLGAGPVRNWLGRRGCGSCGDGTCCGIWQGPGWNSCGGCGKRPAGEGCCRNHGPCCLLGVEIPQIRVQDWILGPKAQENGWFINGWVDQGFTGNTQSPENNFNSPVVYNDRANEWLVNQVYVAMGRNIRSDTCFWDIGGRVDVLYGSDYFFTTAAGLETEADGITQRWNSNNGPRGFGAAIYGLSLPQAYLEVFAPIGSGLRVKLGRYYTILGYESAMAPENFFYSHSYSFQYGQPLTHTGAQASYDLDDCWTISAGFNRGWDNFEDPEDTYSFLGGLAWQSPTRRTHFSLAVETGDETRGENRTAYTLLLRHRITRCLTYVAEHTYGNDNNQGVGGGDAQWFGIVNYLLYSLSPTLDVGLRYEYFKDNDNSRVFAQPSPLHEGGEYHAWTFGLNWKPCQDIILRPELRWDRSDFVPFGNVPTSPFQGAFNDFGERDQFTLGFDLITRF